MKCNQKFYVCKHCGNLVGRIFSSGVNLVCCGEDMQELKPNVVDAAKEKHVPQVDVNDSIVAVQIGSIKHPMTKEHLIEWIYIETNKGGHRKCLNPNDEPIVKFALTEDEKLVAAYAFCNLHGLWMKEI